MEFFANELVRTQAAELMEVNEDLQYLIKSTKFGKPETADRFLSMVERLIELQEMLYFRASYSDCEDAKEFVDALKESLPFIARDGETDVGQAFRRMKEDILTMKEMVDK